MAKELRFGAEARALLLAGVDQLAEIFADTMLGGFAVPRYELVEMADNAPAAADAIEDLSTVAAGALAAEPGQLCLVSLACRGGDGLRIGASLRRGG